MRALSRVVFALLLAGCHRATPPAPDVHSEPVATISGPPSDVASASPAPSGSAQTNEGPLIASKVIAATVYKLPEVGSRKLGYIRLGQKVRRDAERVDGKGCKGDFYRVEPMGYVCTDDATVDMNDPMVRAATSGPDLSKPMPYHYGFVRATAPQYLRVPTKEEQLKSELALEEHLRWYDENKFDVQRVELGANDVPLDARGFPAVGGALPAGQKLSSQLGMSELLGGRPDEPIPWWLAGGRKVANVSSFDVPEYAVFADRVRRKTGLSLVDAFVAKDGDFERRFAVTVDMRLVPATKIKPDTASMFHGTEVSERLPMPFAFVNQRGASAWKLIKSEDVAKPTDPVPLRAIVPLSGKARMKQGKRFYQTRADATRWLRADDLGIVSPPPAWPDAAEKGQKWIDVSLVQQTLVLYEGKRAVYATLVSSGQDRLGDPKTSKATPRGEFRIRSKHVAAAMDSEENSAVLGGARESSGPKLGGDPSATIARLRKAEQSGERLDEDDRRRLENIKKGRHPEYGITMRRGSQNFELRDVPWIQYFASGYAIHGAYWHDVFGIPRSHGCINLSPIDARLAFMWTEPQVPPGWHGINVGAETGEGTVVVVRE
ncbi:MAG TPA: L,D-transpeptidase [Polyangiaceae bacterium]|jgi:lipoprotein-anchoring transpeptidase ErfK/SrfK|nr:L,D-transpeptidase [Polyangiaceae bacterium]